MSSKKPTNEASRRAAIRLYYDEGTLEVDDGALLSRAKGNPDKGAYVQAWVWVYDSDVTPEDHEK